jgi:hypothetical protein
MADFAPAATPAEGVLSLTSKTLVGNNATVAVPIFRITGAVKVLGLWGVVTTVLGANNTAAFWRLNDQTAQSNITLATGTTLSAAPAGSTILKITTAGSALTLLNASAGRFQETAANHPELQQFALLKKPGANTDIEFVYTTTDAPTSGAIQFFLRWIPLSADATVTPL